MDRERHPLARRGFLSGLASLPLIGGGVTLIGRPTATAVPLTDVAVAPIVVNPRERARYAWHAFAAAMRDVTAGSDGLHVMGGEQVRSVGYMPMRAPWISGGAVDLMPIERSRGGLSDQHTVIDLG